MQFNIIHSNIKNVGEKIFNLKSKKTKIILSIYLVIAIILGIIGYLSYSLYSFNNIFPGVYVDKIYIGGESKEKAVAILKNAYKKALEGESVTIKSKGEMISIHLDDIQARLDFEKAVSDAFDAGRKGNILNRIIDVVNIGKGHLVVPLQVQINKEMLVNQIKRLSSLVDIPGHDYKYSVNGNNLNIYKEKNGQEINIEEAVNTISNKINNLDFTEISVEPVFKKYKSIDMQEIYDKVCVEPLDATYKVTNYRLKLIPHRIGVKFNIDKAGDLIESMPDKTSYTIPLILTTPKITTSAMSQMFFKDKLSSFSTTFSAQNKSRSYNIELAASKIDGIVLGKGDTFSFNEVVGERSSKTGFQSANVYFGDEIVEGVGGGICQVSTTLYNAALFSNLEVVNRSNHSMTVGYVPFGQDAAVAYGSIDFKFKNNTSWPIKILARTAKSSISFDIIGINENPQKKVEIINNTLKTVPFTKEYIDSNEMYRGEKKVKQKGVNGYVIETYKVVKENGNEVSRTRISTSTYKPIKEKILNGTKEKPVVNNPQSQDTETEQAAEAFKPKTEVLIQDQIFLEQEQPAESAESEAPIN